MSVVANMASSFAFKLLIFPLSGGASSVQKYFPILCNYSVLFGGNIICTSLSGCLPCLMLVEILACYNFTQSVLNHS